MKRAIVLSGGGSKGAYQIGVWKALKKLKINYDIVTGTSIGSVNGIMMVQKEYHKAAHLWKNVGFSDIFDVQFDKNMNKIEIYKKYALEFLKNGGMETSKIYKFMNEAYNEKKFFKSSINYGIVTVNISKMKPKIMEKKDLRSNLLKYVLASSTCFPAFQLTNIDDCHYIDGGYYDNLPIQTAIDLGAEEIIAVDLGAVGIKKSIKNKNIKIKYITPRNDLGSFLVFDKNLSRKAIKYGYNDTMKEYGKLEGDKFTFELGALFRNYNNKNKVFFTTLKNIIKNDSNSKIINNIFNYSKYSKLLNKKDFRYLYNIFNDTIEYAGKLLELNDSKIYTLNYYNFCLKQNIIKYEPFSKKYIKTLVSNKIIKRNTNKRAIMIFIYNELKNKSLNKIEFLALINLYPKEFMVALYIILL